MQQAEVAAQLADDDVGVGERFVLALTLAGHGIEILRVGQLLRRLDAGVNLSFLVLQHVGPAHVHHIGGTHASRPASVDHLRTGHVLHEGRRLHVDQLGGRDDHHLRTAAVPVVLVQADGVVRQVLVVLGMIHTDDRTDGAVGNVDLVSQERRAEDGAQAGVPVLLAQDVEARTAVLLPDADIDGLGIVQVVHQVMDVEDQQGVAHQRVADIGQVALTAHDLCVVDAPRIFHIGDVPQGVSLLAEDDRRQGQGVALCQTEGTAAPEGRLVDDILGDIRVRIVPLVLIAACKDCRHAEV